MTTSDAQNGTGMAARSIFRVLGTKAAESAARLGRLEVPNRKPIDTPGYTTFASRGSIPHVTPDNVTKYTSLDSAYMALEDFVEKKEPPVINMPRGENRSRIHSFTAFPSDITTIMAPRRCPPVQSPTGNTAKQIYIFTSTGFRRITASEYASWMKSLQADIMVPLADLPHTSLTPSSKKLMRMKDHTEDWLDEFLGVLGQSAEESNIFAPVLPIEYPIQWDYLRNIAEDMLDRIKGLAVYDVNLLPDLANYDAFGSLPKLSLDPPATPYEVLRQVSLGVDMVFTPFINNTSDAGVALSFTFPAPERNDEPLQLGEDMWSPENRARVEPIVPNCPCYACTTHHRAFINHLLNAKEMLGWTLLQVHNHHVMSAFFSGIRETLSKGGAEAFEKERKRFGEVYDAEMPKGTGERPRARGYHFKSEEGGGKFNKPGWQAENGVIDTQTVPEGEGDNDLEEKGFAQKQ